MSSGSPLQQTNTLAHNGTSDFLNTATGIVEPGQTAPAGGNLTTPDPLLFGPATSNYPAASGALSLTGPSPLTSTSTLISNGNLSINLEWDSSVITLNNNAATNYYESEIASAASILVHDLRVNNSITLNIQIKADQAGGGAAGGPSGGSAFAYSTVRSDLINNAIGTNYFSELPNGNNISGSNNTQIVSWSSVDVWSAQQKALGLLAGNASGLDGSVDFGMTIASSDLVGVALHEIAHAMGRVPDGPATPDIFNLFEFVRQGTILAYDSTNPPWPAGYFSVDGGATTLAAYGTQSDNSDYLNTPGLNDPFTEYYDANTPQTLTALDLKQMNVLGYSTACFAEGTALATPHGPVAVEALRPGDTLLTTSGAVRPVRWIGFRHVDLTRHPAPEQACPIRIRAGALGEGVPARDLRISPEHALFLDGGLVPARLLVNGSSIVREAQCRHVVWYHVELDTHDLVLAEGAPTETYLDTGNRGLFENGGEALVLHPDFTAGQAERIARSCAPLLHEPAQVEPIWRRLADQAAAQGFGAPPTVPVTADPDLAIRMDGQVFRPVGSATGRHVFVLPKVVGDVRLVSRATAPSALQPWVADWRRLGVYVSQLTIRSATGTRVVTADDPMLSDGWFAVEHDGTGPSRWTNGDAMLPLEPGQPVVVEIACQPLSGYELQPAAQHGQVRAAA